MVNRHTVIKHEKSTKGTPISMALISNLALELSRSSDGTINRAIIAENFQTAFDLLTQYDEKLADLQGNETHD